MAAGDQQPTPWVSGMNKRIMPSMTALQCFEAVARHMSFTLAAQDLKKRYFDMDAYLDEAIQAERDARQWYY